VTPILRSRSLEQLTLSWNGISLRFSRSASLSGYDASTGAGAIVLADGSRLRLAPGTDIGGSLTVQQVPSSESLALVIPFSVSGVMRGPEPGAALTWTRQGKTYLLALPAGSGVDLDAGTLTLPRGSWTATLSVQGTAAVAAAAAAPTARSARQQARLPDEKAMPGAPQLQAAIAAFLDASYAGWTAGRAIAEQGLWKMPDGSSAFAEDIGSAMLAESVARGTWPKLFPAWSDALARQQRRTPAVPLAYTASPFVGGVRDFARSIEARSTARVGQVRGLLERSDPSALATEGLLPLLADHGTPGLLQAAAGLLSPKNLAALDVPSAVGLLEGLLDNAELTGTTGAVFERAVRDALDRKLLPAVRTTNAGVFLAEGEARVDVRRSIRCGTLFLRAAALVDHSLARAVGRGLIVAGLSLADDAGFLPRTLTLGASRIASREAGLAPESIYALLPLDRPIAREVPLARQVGAGAWLWTSATLLSINSSPAGIALVLGYPAGVPHHFVLRGVPSFAQVKLHGIAWRTDPTYYRYSDGWAYDPSTQTFFGKLTGRSEQEEIDIEY
jgi:hypothetical protein